MCYDRNQEKTKICLKNYWELGVKTPNDSKKRQQKCKKRTTTQSSSRVNIFLDSQKKDQLFFVLFVIHIVL